MRSRVDHVWRAFREGGGHAGPFELSSQAAATEEVHITVTANVLPGRHLLILSGGGARIEEPEARGAAPQAPTANHVPRFTRGGPTSREREVLALLAAGATDEQIAGLLELSPADRADARPKREGQARRAHPGAGRRPGAPGRDDRPELTGAARPDFAGGRPQLRRSEAAICAVATQIRQVPRRSGGRSSRAAPVPAGRRRSWRSTARR